MSDVESWSEVAAQNNAAPPNGFPEGQTPPSVNNAAREVMAALRKFISQLPWIQESFGSTVTQLSTTQFRIAGIDVTGKYPLDRQVKVGVASPADFVYGRITVSSFTGGNTDITLRLDDSVATVPSGTDTSFVSCMITEAGLPLRSELAALLVDPYGSPGNLIADGGFESADLGLYSLTNGGATGFSIVTVFNSGAFGMRFDPTSQGTDAFLRFNGATPDQPDVQVAVRVGDRFVIDGYFKYTGTAPGIAAIQLGMEFRNELGTILVTELQTAFTPTTSFVRHEFTSAAAPAGTIYVVPLLKILTGTAAGATYEMDDFTKRFLIPSASLGPSAAFGLFKTAVGATSSFFDGTDETVWQTVITSDPVTIVGQANGGASPVRINHDFGAFIPQIFNDQTAESAATQPTIRFRLIREPGTVTVYESPDIGLSVMGPAEFPLPTIVDIVNPGTGITYALQMKWENPKYDKGTISSSGTTVTGVGTRFIDWLKNPIDVWTGSEVVQGDSPYKITPDSTDTTPRGIATVTSNTVLILESTPSPVLPASTTYVAGMDEAEKSAQVILDVVSCRQDVEEFTR